MRAIQNKEAAIALIGGTSLKGHINCYYSELVQLLGEPTFPEQSDKIFKEWVVMHNGKVFTIYDWKSNCESAVIYHLQEWNIGGVGYAGEFISELNQKLEDQRYYNYIEEQEASLVYFLN